jgi:hypothetical protein
VPTAVLRIAMTTPAAISAMLIRKLARFAPGEFRARSEAGVTALAMKREYSRVRSLQRPDQPTVLIAGWPDGPRRPPCVRAADGSQCFVRVVLASRGRRASRSRRRRVKAGQRKAQGGTRGRTGVLQHTQWVVYGAYPDPCTLCGGPADDAGPIPLWDEGEPIPTCKLCGEPVDHRGRTVMSKRPLGPYPAGLVGGRAQQT